MASSRKAPFILGQISEIIRKSTRTHDSKIEADDEFGVAMQRKES